MILMIFVIPVFETMFKSAGQSLPLPTLIVLTMSKIHQEIYRRHYSASSFSSIFSENIIKRRRGKCPDRSPSSQIACLWTSPQKGRRRPVLPNAGNPGQQRRSHPGRAYYCLEDGWEPNRRNSHPQRPSEHPGGRDHRRAPWAGAGSFLPW